MGYQSGVKRLSLPIGNFSGQLQEVGFQSSQVSKARNRTNGNVVVGVIAIALIVWARLHATHGKDIRFEFVIVHVCPVGIHKRRINAVDMVEPQRCPTGLRLGKFMVLERASHAILFQCGDVVILFPEPKGVPIGDDEFNLLQPIVLGKGKLFYVNVVVFHIS